MRTVGRVLSVLMVLSGGVWILQGVNLLPGSYMTGGPRWAVRGLGPAGLGGVPFASIPGPAAAYYGVSDLSIGLLSMSFMIAYLFLALPASWVIDPYGFRAAGGVGVGLAGVFGLIRG